MIGAVAAAPAAATADVDQEPLIEDNVRPLVLDRLTFTVMDTGSFGLDASEDNLP